MDLPTEAEPVKVVEGDCLAVLRDLPDGCVDAVITDPPYPCIDRPYGYWTEAEWFALMNPVVEECRRVLKPSGSAVFILQPNSERVGRLRTWLWEFMAKWGRDWGMVQDVWWWNPNAMPGDRGGLCRASVKPCVWLGSPQCYRDPGAVLWSQSESHIAQRSMSRFRREQPSGHGINRGGCATATAERGGSMPFNLLPVANNRDGVHPAATPLNLARWWARYICPPGGLVLDPFGGSGTTGIAAMAEGRQCLLIEKEPAYAAIARKRVAEAMGAGSLFAGATS